MLGDKIATRDSYGNALVELGKEHDNIVVLDADLAEATKTIKFREAFPDRHSGRHVDKRFCAVYELICHVCGRKSF